MPKPLTDYSGRCGGCAWSEPAEVTSDTGYKRHDFCTCTHPETKTAGNLNYKSRRKCSKYVEKGQPKPEPKKTRTVYMKVTKDEFELPIAIADSKTELAIILGRSVKSVHSIYSHNKAKAAHGTNSHYIEVEIEDD